MSLLERKGTQARWMGHIPLLALDIHPVIDVIYALDAQGSESCKQSRVMHRAQLVGNKLCYDKAVRRKQNRHKVALNEVKSSVDCNPPKSHKLFLNRRNLKKEYMKKERFIEIDRDNLNLLERMKSILKRPTTVSSSRKRQSSPTNAFIVKASDEQQYRRRVRQRMEVQFQNEKIAERLQSVKSVYNNNSLAEEWMKTEDYFRRACTLPIADGMLTSPSPRRRGTGKQQILRRGGKVRSKSRNSNRRKGKGNSLLAASATGGPIDTMEQHIAKKQAVTRPNTSYQYDFNKTGSPRRPEQTRPSRERFISSRRGGRRILESNDVT